MTNPMILRDMLIGEPDCRNFIPYYTNSVWGIDDTFFIYFSEKEDGGKPVLNKFYPESGMTKMVVELDFIRDDNPDVQESMMINSVFSAKRNTLYIPCRNTLWKVELDSGRMEALYSFNDECRVGGPLCINEDENLLCGGRYFQADSPGTPPARNNLFIYDILSGSVLTDREIPMFATHFQFMRGGENILFAHEGATETIPDRLNIYNIIGDSFSCIYSHQRNDSGELVEFIGHEKVAGNKVAAVRYPVSVIEFGLILADPGTGVVELLDHDDYWHCSANADGTRFAMDTMWWGNASRITENQSDIIVFDLDSRQKFLLKSIAAGNSSQIYHPHPQLNRAGDKVLYHSRDGIADGSAACRVGFLEIVR